MSCSQADPLDYDRGYDSVKGFTGWGSHYIRLQLGWLIVQIKADPKDYFRIGRYDALCDMLARKEIVTHDNL